MGSARLPGKVLAKVGNHCILGLINERLKKSKELDKIIVATSINTADNKIINFCESNNIEYFRGSEDNVLERFYTAALKYQAQEIVRITADCPLVDPKLVDRAIRLFRETSVDYLSNVNPPTYPDGYDVEVFSMNALSQAFKNSTTRDEIEHVTPYIRNSKLFKSFNLSNNQDYSGIRLTVDEKNDLLVIKELYNFFEPDIFFSLDDVINAFQSNPEKFRQNAHIKRNEGLRMNKGQKLYIRAKDIIPGGNMLLSKRPEMWLPDNWPSYYSKAKGCKIWDLDNIEYIDMASMGIGTNILGYAHPEVEEVVIKAVTDGNMSTLNCPEEVLLAEKLLDLHSWADMVKFARSGGEANAISIRIARAFTGKDKIAVCGYHGWHDWYLSMNITEEDGLKKHLLSGLNPSGVPKGLKNTVYGFEYNNFEQLEDLIMSNKNNFAAIKMEVKRNNEPENNFLLKIRKLATENNIVLIFDECTSGFRETNGGLHKKYNVNPDLAIFGKALGNGHAITSVIGKRDIMQAAQNTFISSTFWTERIGPAAGLKTLEIMEREKSWENITNKGNEIMKRWHGLATNYSLEIELFGIPALCGFNFVSKDNLAYKTFITQEMLKNNILAGNTIYSSIAHSEEDIDNYFYYLDVLFQKIADFESGDDIYKYLNGPICHSGFKRLN